MTKEELQIVIQKGEGYTTEFKESINSDLSKELTLKVSDAVSDAVKARLFDIVKLVHDRKIVRLTEMTVLFSISRVQLQRHIKVLRDAGILLFKGSSKTGGYLLTDSFKDKLDNNI